MDKIKRIRVASDKSMSHRAIIFSSIAKGTTQIENVLFSDDTLRSIKAMNMLGINFDMGAKNLTVEGKGKYSLIEPFDVVNMGNSGTSARLISGLLSSFNFFSVITGDDSLKKRPMNRIIEPLSKMGAKILSRSKGFLPMAIKGRTRPLGIKYRMPVASAQVKSAILLAGLYSDDEIVVFEPSKSRDHTENMLRAFGVDVLMESNFISLGYNRELESIGRIEIPADISSSAFFMVYAALRKGSELILNDVLLNPTRTGILDVFDMVGVRYEILNRRVKNFEVVGDVFVRFSNDLKPFTVSGELVPRLIDEIPILSILAAFCDGVSEFRDVYELRKKESDRISSICENLNRVGIKTEELSDGFKVYGYRNPKILPAVIETYFDHRIAMSFLILKAITGIDIEVSEMHSISTSYPNFMEHLNYVSI